MPNKQSEGSKLASVVAYNNGESIGTIAKRVGVSRQSMWDVLRRRTKLRTNLKYGPENHFYRGETKDSDWAQNKVEKALKRGDIARPELCQSCGNNKRFKDGRSGIQAHHPDYNQPLEVMWLCQPCHHAWHKTNKAIPRVQS